MNAKKLLTPNERLIYEDFKSGLTEGGISIKRRLPYAEVLETRYQILKKGYSLNANTPEEPTETKTVQRTRGKNTTPEEREAILVYRETHTARETAEHFGRGTSFINHLTRDARNTAQNAPECTQAPAEVQAVQITPSAPESVLRAENDRLRAMIQGAIPAEVVQAALDQAEALGAEADRREEEARVYRSNAATLQAWAEQVLSAIACKTQKQEGAT